MSIIVFVGPSLRSEDLEKYPSIIFLPPVAQGDLYSAVQQHDPRAVGIIDGYFDGMPAVWHKEILWALDNGIAVLGAASMGALRGAELHAFGMRGIGNIFEGFRDEILTDDDEVALVHGPAEAGYVALSEPMVNIRATVAAAMAEGVLDEKIAKQLLQIAKEQYYQERTWKSVSKAAAEQITTDKLTHFVQWYPENKVDQKRHDALALLDALTADDAAAPTTGGREWVFEWTDMWHEVSWRKNGTNAQRTTADTEKVAAVLNELRLDPGNFRATMDRALLRRLANHPSDKECEGTHQQAIRNYMTTFRQVRGLFNRQSLDAWLQEHDLDAVDFERLMVEATAVEESRSTSTETFKTELIEQLKLDGLYVDLFERSQNKTKALATCRSDGRSAPPIPALLSWYFVTRLDAGIPDDLEKYSRGLGLRDLPELYELLAEEYLFEVSSEAMNDESDSGSSITTNVT
ncbi:MAG: TfuA-like protein [Stappiaceae bacterium]